MSESVCVHNIFLRFASRVPVVTWFACTLTAAPLKLLRHYINLIRLTVRSNGCSEIKALSDIRHQQPENSIPCLFRGRELILKGCQPSNGVVEVLKISPVCRASLILLHAFPCEPSPCRIAGPGVSNNVWRPRSAPRTSQPSPVAVARRGWGGNDLSRLKRGRARRRKVPGAWQSI